MNKLFFTIIYLPYIIKNWFPIKTEPNVDVKSYLGLWNQVATSRSSALLGTGIRFTNVTARYDILNNSDISVYNSGFNKNNNYTSIQGYSYVTGKSQTKRKLHFEGVPVDGNYWIVKLGPIKENKYRYAIVSGPLTPLFATRFSLYVLARNRKEYEENYEKDVKQWCQDNNFRFFWNKYIATP
jgi:lipocalin